MSVWRGSYAPQLNGLKPGLAASGESLMMNLVLIQGLIRIAPNLGATMNQCRNFCATSGSVPDVVNVDARAARVVLHHCRRIKRDARRWKQATNRLSPENIARLRDALSKAKEPAWGFAVADAVAGEADAVAGEADAVAGKADAVAGEEVADEVPDDSIAKGRNPVDAVTDSKARDPSVDALLASFGALASKTGGIRGPPALSHVHSPLPLYLLRRCRPERHRGFAARPRGRLDLCVVSFSSPPRWRC